MLNQGCYGELLAEQVQWKINERDVKVQVPLLDLKAQYATLREEMRPAVDAVLESQYFIGGPEVKELETQIRSYWQAIEEHEKRGE